MLLFVAAYAVAVPTGQLEVTSSGLDAELTGLYGAASFVLWLGLGTAYHTLLESRYGRTVGKYLVILSDTSEATVGGSFDRERAFRWRVPDERVHVLVSDSMKIRVVSDDGSSPPVTATLVRNVLRIVDWLPLLYVVGSLTMLLSDRNTRLGDRVANTVVVR